MRDRRRPTIVFFTTAAALAASSVPLASGADAAPAAPGQGAVSLNVCVAPGIRFGESSTAPSVVTSQIPGGLPAGRFRVSVTTSDGYPGRTETPFEIETSERVTVYGQTSQDLADGVESDIKILTFEVTFTEPQTVVTVSHTPAEDHPDSVRVDQMCWSQLDATSTSTSTTVSTPATVLLSSEPTVPVIVKQTIPAAALVEATTTTTGTGTSLAVTQRLPLAPSASAVVSDPAFTG